MRSLNYTSEDSNTTEFFVQCTCGARAVFHLPTDRFVRWKLKGELIQDVFPEYSADVREWLVSGTCPKCWDLMFPEED